jgi:hypothetical protein
MPYAPIMPNKTDIVNKPDIIDNIAIYSYHEGTKEAPKGLSGCDPVNQSSSLRSPRNPTKKRDPIARKLQGPTLREITPPMTEP